MRTSPSVPCSLANFVPSVIIATVGQAVAGHGPGVSILGVLIFWRFLMGLGIGGDYPLSATITSEFAATKIRGRMMTVRYFLTCLTCPANPRSFVRRPSLLPKAGDSCRQPSSRSSSLPRSRSRSLPTPLSTHTTSTSAGVSSSGSEPFPEPLLSTSA